MAFGYIPLPTFRAPQPLDFSGLNEGLDVMRQNMERNRLLQQQQEIGQAALSPQQSQSQQPVQPTNRLMTGASPAASGLASNAADFIKQQEGYAPTAKWDVRQNSGGYGSKAAPGEQFTPEKAEAYLQRDMAPGEQWLSANAPNLTPSQRTALSSAAYNLGVGALDKLKPDIQAGDWNRVAARLKTFNNVRDDQGRLTPSGALTSRREREAALLAPGNASQPSAPSYQAPASPINYGAAIQVALRQGNIALAQQLQNAQQEGENTAYTRQRQSVQDAQSAESHDVSMRGARHDLETKYVTGLAAAAQMVQREADPAKKSAMWQQLVSHNPEIAQMLPRFGVGDPADANAGAKALIARAQGMTGKKYEFTKYGVGDPSTGELRAYPPGINTEEKDFGLNPIPGTDAQGNPVFFQPSKAGGQAKRVQFEEGFTPSKPLQWQDFGTFKQGYDQFTNKPAVTQQVDVAGEEAAKKNAAAQVERDFEKPQAQKSMDTALSNLDGLKNKVNELIGMEGLPSATGVFQGSGWVPNVWQNTADADSAISNIKGKVAMVAMQAMRDASKTGGAAGSMTEKEWPIIESMIANLDRSQGDDRFKAQLTELVNYVDAAKARITSAYQQTYPVAGAAPSAPPPAAVEDPLGIR